MYVMALGLGYLGYQLVANIRLPSTELHTTGAEPEDSYTIEDYQTSVQDSQQYRYHTKGNQLMDRFIGQFGIPENLQYDTHGSVTRTFGNFLDSF